MVPLRRHPPIAVRIRVSSTYRFGSRVSGSYCERVDRWRCSTASATRPAALSMISATPSRSAVPTGVRASTVPMTVPPEEKIA